MKLALLVDFDGTITEEDVAGILLDAFALEDWRRYEPMLEAGLINGREAHVLDYTSLPSKEEELTRFAVERAAIRPGFEELVSYCREAGIPMTVASGGLGFYIRAVLSQHRLSELPMYSAEADFTAGKTIRVSYDGAAATCDMVGACKCFHVHKYASLGYKVALIGDGISDTCAAGRADYVFARRGLQAHCEAQGIPFFPFTDFHDVLAQLQTLERA
jgi:2,3-diketo-5-methylthio-1-phosphopentane phosphatase